MPKKSKLYTRHGDQGETSLFGGERVPKDHLRVEAYGQLDHLSATIGLLVVSLSDDEVAAELRQVQNDLFDLGAELATPPDSRLQYKLPQLIGEADWRRLEGLLDAYDAQVPPLRTFVLPGGHETAARAHLARTTCRTAERAVVRLAHEEEVRADVLTYLNRLSDFLFVCARLLNHRAGVHEVTWQPRPRDPDTAE
ncbi:cob(I)yrinic acid a,c-diamide adenosyltransferase [Longimicrobium sp.]|uniref:cob(I)yrinic acid a,c-diamide adenosyltransferase n=1 Tax=Longimicrobium sp. TaxID=2029185 RepID=UPI003B3A16DF